MPVIVLSETVAVVLKSLSNLECRVELAVFEA